MIPVEKIAQDNDLFRETMIRSPRHKIVFSEMVADLASREAGPGESRPCFELLSLVRQAPVLPGNDPHGEHDFGSVDLDGEKYYWKIDYYDEAWEYGADPKEGPVSRLLTIMHSSEY